MIGDFVCVKDAGLLYFGNIVVILIKAKNMALVTRFFVALRMTGGKK